MEWFKEIQYDCKEIGDIQYENIKIIIRKETIASIKKKSKRLIGTRSFGLLIGNKYKDKGSVLIYIEGMMPLGNISTASNGFIFTDKRWAKIKERIQKNNPEKEIVGWYGVRSGWEAMVTEEDQRIHQSYFDKPWQIIYLLDRKSNSVNFYYWDNKRLNRCKGYYQLEDNKDNKRNKETKIANKHFKGPVLVAAVLLLIGLYSKFVHPYIALSDNKDKDSIGNNYGKKGEEVTYLSKQNPEEGQIEKSEPLELDKKNTELPKEDVKKTNSEPISESIKENKNNSAEENAEDSMEQDAEKMTNEQDIEKLQKSKTFSEDGAVIHIIKKGDTLIELSKQYYGDPSYTSILAKVNRISDYRSLRIGDYLIIPSRDEIEKLK